jgi:hypothetical protein
MKEINKLILKEKQQDNPNKDYIQWLQQLTDKELTANFIAEVKQKKFLKELYESNTIELDHYFKNSGKTEKTTGEYKRIENNEKSFQKWIQQNPKADAMREHMEFSRQIQMERKNNYNRYKSNKKAKDV